jgi:hypothetical protein
MDSGFFSNDGFDAELDAVAFENTALNNMDPIREAQLFEQFEQDYRSGGYDPGTNADLEETRERFGPDPRDISGYRPLAKRTDSGYHLAPEPEDRRSDGRRPDDRRSDDRRADDRRAGRPAERRRHGKSRPAEGGARIPMFGSRSDSAPRPRPAGSNQQSPFGELSVYVVPIAVAVVVVMVLVVLLLNR